MRKVINDEDKCNLAIKRELEKGPNRIRVLSREELKMEVKKFKNISIRIAAELSKLGQKVPAYVANIMKEN